MDEQDQVVEDRKENLLNLKQQLTVDVFLGYQSNCDHAGVEVPYQSLEMFKEFIILRFFSFQFISLRYLRIRQNIIQRTIRIMAAMALRNIPAKL